MTPISPVSRVTLKEDVLVQELQGDAVLLDLKTGVYFGLDQMGTRMWNLMGEHKLISQVIQAITEQFDVSEQQCSADVLAFARRLDEQGLITIA